MFDFCGLFFALRNGGRKITSQGPLLSARALEAGVKI
jgi:hypothetical protein